MGKIKKHWWKGIKQDLNKWRYILCSWIRRLNIVKMSVLSNFTYRFNIIKIKNSASYFVDSNKLILKFRGKSVYVKAKDLE